jgi:protein TonB
MPPDIDVVTTEPDTNAVLIVAQEIAEFPGGNEEMIKFISKNLVYPKDAVKAGIEGNVIVQFVVEKDGSPSNIIIKKGLGYGCDEEVIRVVKAMPKWKPGKQNGKPARVQMVLPVKFRLN